MESPGFSSKHVRWALKQDPGNQVGLLSADLPSRRRALRTGQVDSADKPLAEKDVGGRHLTHHVPLLDGSPQMRAIMRIVESVADTEPTVLIRGESGVGKDLDARAIHPSYRHHHGPHVNDKWEAHPLGRHETRL